MIYIVQYKNKEWIGKPYTSYVWALKYYTSQKKMTNIPIRLIDKNGSIIKEYDPTKQERQMQKTISFLIEEGIKKILKEMAKEVDRSLTAFIRIQLTKMAKEWKDNK